MKKFLIAAIVSLTCLSQSAFATLSPFWQSNKEIVMILSDSRLADYFQSQEEIRAIIRAENGYFIRGDRTKCFVEIIYLPSSQPGPAKFKLEFRSHDQD